MSGFGLSRNRITITPLEQVCTARCEGSQGCRTRSPSNTMPIPTFTACWNRTYYVIVLHLLRLLWPKLVCRFTYVTSPLPPLSLSLPTRMTAFRRQGII